MRSGKSRSGAHTNTLGCNTRVRTSPHVRAPSPSILFRECISSARRVSSAGCTQGPPVSSALPSSILRATERAAFFTTAVESAPAVMFGSLSVAMAGVSTLGLTNRLSMRGRSRATGCGCVLACSMSRTEGLPGLRSPAEIPVAAAWACVQALFRILLDVASDESPGRLCCWAFLMLSRPLPARVPC